jgi:hypothetical protein
MKPRSAVTTAGDVKTGLCNQVGEIRDRIGLGNVSGPRAEQVGGDGDVEWAAPELGDEEPPARPEHAIRLE